MKLVLALPPLTQLNTPYPSTAFLARSLRAQGISATQRDLGLGLVLRLFSRDGLGEVLDAIDAAAEAGQDLPEPAWRALALRDQHLVAVESAVRFLQGKDPTLAWRLAAPGLLPGGPRLDAGRLDGDLPDRARHRATLYLEDIADLVAATIDDGFALARYQHHLAVGPVGFGPIAERLARTTLIDRWLDEATDALLSEAPDVVGLSIPFPGTLYGALRIGARLKAAGVTVVLGGGYVSTELREVATPELWRCTDHLVYDDGEQPLLALLQWLDGGPDRRVRTRSADGLYGGETVSKGFTDAAWYGEGEGALPLGDYLSVLDTLNPAHRLWSDGRWNKVLLAHGCYWKRCAFCDVNLDYIARYEPTRVGALVDRIAELAEDTGTSGFHFVDEAAPPRLMRDLALELLARGLAVSWWGNIRFERTFTPDLCRLLAASGLVAVTGGLEVASDRLLTVMDKGITVTQAARAAHAFRSAGVLVHAYLMYGFPSETAQETVDSAETVRQLFAVGALQSAFWHRFVLTRHAPVAAHPDRYGITVPPLPTDGPVFATNDLPHHDPVGADPDDFDRPLVEALAAWMRGEGLDRPVTDWLGGPAPSVPSNLVATALERALPAPRDNDRLVWIGGQVLEQDGSLLLQGGGSDVVVGGLRTELDWLGELLAATRPSTHPGADPVTLAEARAAFPGHWAAFAPRWQAVRRAGLLIV